MKRLFAVLVLASMTACATRPVMLTNPVTGATAKCGPFSTTDNYGSAGAAAIQEANCVNDFKQQGFVRAAN